MNKSISILFLIISLIVGCDNSESPVKGKSGNSFTNKYGTINPNEVSKIVVADKNEKSQEALKLEIKDKKYITAFINEINLANKPQLIKGGGWSLIKINLEDTIIELRVDANSVGLPRSSGTFYFFNNPRYRANPFACVNHIAISFIFSLN